MYAGEHAKGLTKVTAARPRQTTDRMEYQIEHRTLQFRQPAGTSRGIYRTHDVWYVTLRDGEWSAVGECAPLPDLSCDAFPLGEMEEYLHAACQMTCQMGRIPTEHLRDYPSILFALESALQTSSSADEEWLRKQGMPINGLVWMGNYEQMRERLEEKLQAGFHCVKLKIGAINFDDELALIRRVREEYSQEQVQLRVDANGAFGTTAEEAIGALYQLSAHHLHSIEQPIRQGHWAEMAQLCKESPLPIALDEELIGVNTTEKKMALLDTIRPQYIVLKPSLHGGLSGCDEWIRLAEERGIGWWATSALESNVGLAAIARWVAQHRPTLPQGLGTGLLYTNNTEAKTEVREDRIYLI